MQKTRPTITGAVLEVTLALAVVVVIVGAYQGWFTAPVGEAPPAAKQDNARHASQGSVPS